MSRKTRRYLFYDTTTSVCSSCLHPVEAKIIFKGSDVFMDKWCSAHGAERVGGAADALPRSANAGRRQRQHHRLRARRDAEKSMKEHIFKLFATNHSPESQANCLSESMCCLPLIDAPAGLGYENVFRALIVQFMDAYSLDVPALKKSCIHFAQQSAQRKGTRKVIPIGAR